MSIKIVGASQVSRNFKRYAEAVQRESVSILRQEARALAVELGKATMPGPGFDEAKAQKFRGTVENNVRKVYASKQDPSAIFSLLKKQAPHLAGAYWRAHKSNKPRAAADIVRRAGLSPGIDPSALKKARSGKRGRVPGPKDPVSIATEAQVRAFARKQSQLVGLAKAGWYAAAKALGGRVRRNIVNPGGRRATAEIFPASVRKLASRFPGLGGARISGGDQAPKVEIFTNVRHAADALSGGQYASAVSRAQERVKRDLAFSMSALRKKIFRNVA
jgi:hypothetical protein